MFLNVYKNKKEEMRKKQVTIKIEANQRKEGKSNRDKSKFIQGKRKARIYKNQTNNKCKK